MAGPARGRGGRGTSAWCAPTPSCWATLPDPSGATSAARGSRRARRTRVSWVGFKEPARGPVGVHRHGLDDIDGRIGQIAQVLERKEEPSAQELKQALDIDPPRFITMPAVPTVTILRGYGFHVTKTPRLRRPLHHSGDGASL